MNAPTGNRRFVRTLLLAILSLFLCAGILAPTPAAAQKKKKGKGKQERKKEDGVGDDLEGKEYRQLLTLSLQVRQDDRGWWVIVAKGSAQMPDNLELTVSLHLALASNDAIEIKTHIPVKDGAFGLEEPVEFGPYEGSTIANDWYWGIVRFRYEDQQDTEALAAFRQMFPKEGEWKGYVDISDRATVRLGTEAQEAREDLARKKHYLACTKTFREILKEYDEGLASALRAGFTSNSEWERYVREKRILRDEGDALDQRLEEVKERGRFVEGGKLEEKEWREFLDREASKEIATHSRKTGGLRGRILRVLSDHKEFKKSRLAWKLPTADKKLDKLVTGLYGLSMRWSRVVYKNAGLPVDPRDRNPADPIVVKGNPSHNNLLTLAAGIEKEVEVYLPGKKK